MRGSQIQEKGQEFDISIRYAIEMRLRYLVNLAGHWDDYIDCKTDDIPALDLPKIFKEIDSLRKFEQRLVKGVTLTNEITDDMIQAARDYPITDLFEFERGNRIKCPFHGSKDNDLSYHPKSNTVRCFGSCGKSWDTIQVCIERDGMDFITAVRHLNN